MRHIAIATLLLGPFAFAQTSNTLPSGFDHSEGTSRLHPGWSASLVYVPARMTYCYDRALFPWTDGRTIRQISVRRDTDIAQTYRAHRKTLKIRMSTNGFAARRPRLRFEEMLGADRRYVFGDASTWRTVDFPASPASPGPAAFDVRIVFDAPFLCPGSAQTLQVDVIVLGNDSQQGTWAADAVSFPGFLGRGGSTRLTGACPGSLPAPGSNSCWPGGDLHKWMETAKPQTAVVGLLGLRLATPLAIGPCTLHVQPWALAVVSSESGSPARAAFRWGRLPVAEALVGTKLTFQALAVEQGGPFLDLGKLSDAIEITIGSGFPETVLGSVAFDHGKANVPSDPDRAFDARRLQARVPVLRLD